MEGLLAEQFRRRLDPSVAPLYSRMLVGTVALTGQHWAEVREPAKEVVAAHLVNFASNGLSSIEKSPVMSSGEDDDADG